MRLAGLLVVIHLSVACAGSTSGLRAVSAEQGYDQATLALGPVLYLSMRSGTSDIEPDLSHHGQGGTYASVGSARGSARLPNGEDAAVFDGSASLQVQSSRILSISHTGSLTVEAWINPATLHFTDVESSGYVQWLGKGAPGEYEYALRMYSQGNTEGRDSRISGYAFNLRGGKGSGAYFQDPVEIGAWIMVAVEYDTASSPAFPSGWVAIFKDGVLRKKVGLDQYGVVPRPGPAPFSVGTVTGRSFFQGSIAKVAVFDGLLTSADILGQYHAMVGR